MINALTSHTPQQRHQKMSPPKKITNRATLAQRKNNQTPSSCATLHTAHAADAALPPSSPLSENADHARARPGAGHRHQDRRLHRPRRCGRCAGRWGWGEGRGAAEHRECRDPRRADPNLDPTDEVKDCDSTPLLALDPPCPINPPPFNWNVKGYKYVFVDNEDFLKELEEAKKQ